MGVLEGTRIPLALSAPGDLGVPSPLHDLHVSPEPIERPEPAEPRPRSAGTGFKIQPQEQTNWCWAALTTIIARFYDSSSTESQCNVVNREFGRSDCCNDPARSDDKQCNQGGYPESSLPKTGNLRRHSFSPTPFTGVQDEVIAGQPLGVRINWSGGGAHALSIAAYSRPNWIYTQDPWFESTWWNYVSFKSNKDGNWTESYFTQS